MSNSTRSGVFWTGAEKVLVYGVNFIQGVILARLLSPEDFGLTAMLGIFLVISNIFVEGGFGTALVQERNFARHDEFKILGFSCGVAIVLYGILFCIAPQIAAFYREPGLVSILRVLALVILLNAPSSVAYARLQRTMRFRAISVANMAQALFVFACAGCMAWMGCGVWTLVAAALVGSAVRIILLWLAAWKIAAPCEQQEKGTVSRLVHYSWKLVATQLLSSAYGNFVPLILGRACNPAAVGLYARSAAWSSLSSNLVNDMMGRVFFPKMAEVQNDRTSLCRVRQRSVWLGLMFLLPVAVIVEVFAAPLIEFVFGQTWLPAVPYVRILLIGAAALTIAHLNACLLSACGRSDAVLKADLIRRPLDLALLLAGGFWGVLGICWAKVAGDCLDWLVISFFSSRVTGRNLLREMAAL